MKSIIYAELADAHRRGVEVHIGRIFATCTEKDFEMQDEQMRKYKGRVCFDGRRDKVRTQWGVRACFEHLHSVPASMPAGKSGVAYGQIKGRYIKTADARKAYCQSPWPGVMQGGVPTWSKLPKEWWPQEWHDRGLVEPVCLMLRNLYGHPLAGARYEKWAAGRLREKGFMPIENWPSR